MYIHGICIIWIIWNLRIPPANLCTKWINKHWTYQPFNLQPPPFLLQSLKNLTICLHTANGDQKTAAPSAIVGFDPTCIIEKHDTFRLRTNLPIRNVHPKLLLTKKTSNLLRRFINWKSLSLLKKWKWRNFRGSFRRQKSHWSHVLTPRASWKTPKLVKVNKTGLCAHQRKIVVATFFKSVAKVYRTS